MDLNQYVLRVEDGLAAASAIGDEATQRVAGALTSALEPAVRLAVMNALADMAFEVTDALGDRIVDVRLDGTDVRVVVSAPLESEAEADISALPAASGELSRITLRLPEEVKAQAERAAAAQAISLNTWLVRATQQALETGGLPGRTRAPRTHRVRGWVQA